MHVAIADFRFLHIVTCLCAMQAGMVQKVLVLLTPYECVLCDIVTNQTFLPGQYYTLK